MRDGAFCFVARFGLRPIHPFPRIFLFALIKELGYGVGSRRAADQRARGSEPSSWHHTELVPSVTFTWHHTIPWNGLRATWNYLVAGRHWGCVEEYLKIISAPHVALTFKALKNAPATLFPHDEKLLELLTWQSWNIVEGPGNQYRIGDPGAAQRDVAHGGS